MVFVTPSQRVTCLVQMLGAVELEFAVVDIDDTLIDTDRRKWAAWCMVLNREIDFAVVKTSSSKEILTGLGCGSDALWKEFWKILLCWDSRGIELLRLDEPIQFAPEVMQEWAETLGVVYLTGRTSNMHELTLRELAQFGFPVAKVALVMSPNLEDYLASPEQTRTTLLTSILRARKVVVVVDDNPLYLCLYREFGIPYRIGFLRTQRFPRESYCDATTVIASWEELLHQDPLRPAHASCTSGNQRIALYLGCHSDQYAGVRGRLGSGYCRSLIGV